MARPPKKEAFELPEEIVVESINGHAFIAVKAAAKVARVHPAVLAMGQRLVKDGSQGAAFTLGDPNMLKNAAAIEKSMLHDLKRVIRALAGKGTKAKSFLDYDQQRIVFWLE